MVIAITMCVCDRSNRQPDTEAQIWLCLRSNAAGRIM